MNPWVSGILAAGTAILGVYGLEVKPTRSDLGVAEANSEFIRNQLDSCIADLKECYRTCRPEPQ